MDSALSLSQAVFQSLQPGDTVEVVHEVKVGQKIWPVASVGTVVSKDRRRQGLHFARNVDDKVFSDVIVIRKQDGELTTVSLDEFTSLRRVSQVADRSTG
jgi:hypothetical protein